MSLSDFTSEVTRFGGTTMSYSLGTSAFTGSLVGKVGPLGPTQVTESLDVVADHLENNLESSGKLSDTITCKVAESVPMVGSEQSDLVIDSHTDYPPGGRTPKTKGRSTGFKDLVEGKQLSVLLGSATFGGTMAATRELVALGVDVDVFASSLLSAAAWSRGRVRRHSCPPEGNTQNFLDRLLSFGAANPGRILLPTSDETAWLYTVKGNELKKHYHVNQPPLETMRRLLDKTLFTEAVCAAGLPVLPSWELESLNQLQDLAAGLPYPILIKPRTHVHRRQNHKGMVSHSKEDLIRDYRTFVDRESFQTSGSRPLSKSSLPLLQEFVDVSGHGVCSVSGFIDETGDLFVTRRSKKVFQRSLPVGVGVCFESLPADPELSDAAYRLCRELGYFGMFEIEFIKGSNGWSAIDFNGRLFNQAGLDIRRKMPLPLFACLHAIGDREGLREAVKRAQLEDDDNESVFYDRFTLRAILMARTLTGRISREERARWTNWMLKHAAHTVDVASDDRDRLPALIHAMSEISLGVKSFSRFLRSTPRVSEQSYVTEKAHS